MADNAGHTTKTNIPMLTENNYLSWSMRMTAYLRHLSLLKYATDPPIDLSGAAAAAVAIKHNEVVHILMDHLSDAVFEMVVTPDIASSPHQIWSNIIARFASISVNNKGRVWLRFMRYEYNGVLAEFITDMRKILNEVRMLQLGVPDNILSFSILAKLSEDLYNLVDNIIMNDVICENPTAVLSKLQEMVHLEESWKNKPTAKSTPKLSKEGAASALMHESTKSKKGKGRRAVKTRCEPGTHNPAATSHDAAHCYQLHPELRPASWGPLSGNAAPATQLVEVDDGHESEVSLLLVEAPSKPIVLDTGATHHMVNNPAIFLHSSKTNIRISTGGHKNFLNATSIGSAVLVNQEGKKLTLDNVLLVPDLNRCLLSVQRLFDRDLVISKTGGDRVLVSIDGEFELEGTVKNNLLELPSSSFDEIYPNSTCYLSSPVSPDWHVRLGHPNPKYQEILVPKSTVGECEICKLCKLRALPFGSSFKAVKRVLEAVHMDLVGPFSVRSSAGHLYFLTIVDQFSGLKTTKFLKSKDETFGKFLEFKAAAETLTGKKLHCLISDGGGEFVNEAFASLCKSEGLVHHISPAYTPQNNGMAERTNQTIIVKARCLLVQSRLPKSFWAEAVNTATQLSNLTPSATQNFTVPYTVWTGREANLEVLRPFGCSTYSLIPKEQRKFKLLPTGERGIMLGYENDFSSYRIYKPSSRKVFRIRNVRFDESTFPGLSGHAPEEDDELLDIPPENSKKENPLLHSDVPSLQQQSLNTNTGPEESGQLNSNRGEPSQPPKAPRDISSIISTDNILSVDRRGNSILVYLAETNVEEEDNPKSYIQAINSSNSSFWKKAIDKEISNMEEHDVWVIVKKNGDQKRINCTWVFKVK
ncbi:hypothetical protein PSHT_01837 [Puccinia striiformis]|uniref:Integrase catalytic domain-containing protein n=1 Tax=Puccinia striiformis TaxID=27350 RepID=A0A2S4WJC4_9BASI|nr:hypothetical protein PSHT_01837 [Puccinia striiformis]